MGKARIFESGCLSTERIKEIKDKIQSIHLGQWKSDIRKIIEKYPSTRNPFSLETMGCVYSDKYGQHCIIGKYLLESGILTKDEVDDLNSQITADILFATLGFNSVVADIAGELQAIADSCTVVNGVVKHEPFQWGTLHRCHPRLDWL